MFTCYAIDDELSALEILKDYIGSKPNLSLLKTFENPVTALNYITKNAIVDVIFMDVEMPEMSGVELAKLIRHKTRKIIFVTAHARYAYNAYELETDFLLKPYPFAKFNTIIEKIFIISNLSTKPASDFFIIKQPGDRTTKHYIKFNDVIFMESQLRHTKIQTIKGPLISDQSLAKTKDLINLEQRFLQVHRSFIISIDYIKVLRHENVVLENGFIIPIGRNYRNLYSKLVKKN